MGRQRLLRGVYGNGPERAVTVMHVYSPTARKSGRCAPIQPEREVTRICTYLRETSCTCRDSPSLVSVFGDFNIDLEASTIRSA